MENKDVFIWEEFVCSDNAVAVENDTFELSVSNGDYLYLKNKTSREKVVLRKEHITVVAFSRPRFFLKGGFTIIWNQEACDELSGVAGNIRGISIEPEKKDKKAFDELEAMTNILEHNGIRLA